MADPSRAARKAAAVELLIAELGGGGDRCALQRIGTVEFLIARAPGVILGILV